MTLADCAAASGTPVACAGNLPLDLGDPQFVWFVETGAVDVFLVERQDGRDLSALQHVMRIGEGSLLPGVAPQVEETTLSLTAKGLHGTVLRRLPVDGLAGVDKAELTALADDWILAISNALSSEALHRTRPDAFVETGTSFRAERGTYSVRQGVAWVRMSASSQDSCLFMGLIDLTAGTSMVGDSDMAIPLTPSSWLTFMQQMQITVVGSDALADAGTLLESLATLHDAVFSQVRIIRRLATVDQVNIERASSTGRRSSEDNARLRLFGLLGRTEQLGPDGHGSELGRALHAIGRHEGIDFRWPAKSDFPDFIPGIRDVLDVSGGRGRRVRLDHDVRWWIGDSGAMLAYLTDDGRPVALLPSAFGGYRMVDPAQGRRMKVNAELAKSLNSEAWLFYRPLEPAAVRLSDLLGVAGKGIGAALARFTVAGLLGALITLLPAVAIGFIVARVIPTGDVGLLYAMVAALVAGAVIRALIHIYQGMALMRLEGRATSRIEAAFWDRLLRLPSEFLRRFPTGDRAMRGMTFQRIRNSVQGVVANDVLSIVFLLPALLVIFLYDAALAGVAAAFGLLSLLVTVALGLRQISPYRRAARSFRRLTGRLFQLINGIAKLRIDGAEGSAFAAWAGDFREQQLAELELGAWESHLRAFCTALPLLAGALLLLTATLLGPESLAVGDFLVVYIAFMVFTTGVIRFGASLGAAVAIVPELAQIKPFLAESPETSTGGDAVGELGGDVAFDRVSFRYDADGPLILDNVSIQARPGEFVAIAGESGAGKSTLFRIALGLNMPTSGVVYYDRRDLRQLNITQLRQSIGAVPQEVHLHPQDLWDNIVGEHEDVETERVWHATQLASVSEEIAAMPMGLLTCVGDTGNVTSGGESQRLVIARIMMRNPRIMMLDEATNWLDNESQAKIMDNLAQMTSTRIVIAHRLSTLRKADRIYVLQAGRIVQEGNYAELASVDGVFRDLVRRQEA